MRTSKLLTLAALTLWSAIPPAHGQLARSTFDVDADGWTVVERANDSLTVVNTRSPVYTNSGGNPNGYIHATDAAPGFSDFYFRAPAKFLGNQQAAYGYPLMFDLISDLRDTPTQLVYSVILTGAACTNVITVPRMAAPNTWTHFVVMLQAGAGWMDISTGLPSTSQGLSNCLGTLQSLDIAGEFGTGPDTGGIDNVILFGSPPGFDYYQSFDTGISDPNFTLYGYTNSVYCPPYPGIGGVGTNGRLLLYNTNTSSLTVSVVYLSKFLLTGDFETTVKFDESSLGWCAAGLIVYFAPNYIGWLSSCTDGTRAMSSFSFPNMWFPTLVGPNTGTVGLFRIRRVGTTLYADADVGNGYVGIRTSTDPAFGAPVQVALFLTENVTCGPNYMLFDDLSVHADGILAPRLEIQGGTNGLLVKSPAAVATLEATPVLTPVPIWTAVTNVSVVNGWYNTVTITPAEPVRFFRLNWPWSYY